MSTISALSSGLQAASAASSAAAVRGPEAAAAENTGNKAEGSFSQVLSDALSQELREKTITMTASSSELSGMLGNSLGQSGITELLISNAMKTGKLSDAETALFMLCMMLENSSDNSELSTMMSMMSGLFSSIQGDTTGVKESVLQSGYSPYILSTIDTAIFKSSAPPAISKTGSAIVPVEAWKPVSPAIVSTAGSRSPEKLRQVIAQFGVETSARYKPYKRGSDTYCNIFLWDVTSALNCEIPHFVDPVTGAPRKYPDIKGANELDAVEIEAWLVKHGPEYGWREVDAATAQKYANSGRPAVTTAGSIGHVQIVCPSKSGDFDPIRGVTVAQSGARNISYTHISSVYSSASMSKVRYFVHE